MLDFTFKSNDKSMSNRYLFIHRVHGRKELQWNQMKLTNSMKEQEYRESSGTLLGVLVVMVIGMIQIIMLW